MRNYKSTLPPWRASAQVDFLKDYAPILYHKKGKYIAFDTQEFKEKGRLKPRFRRYTIIYKEKDTYKVFMTEKEESLKELIKSL